MKLWSIRMRICATRFSMRIGRLSLKGRGRHGCPQLCRWERFCGCGKEFGTRCGIFDDSAGGRAIPNSFRSWMWLNKCEFLFEATGTSSWPSARWVLITGWSRKNPDREIQREIFRQLHRSEQGTGAAAQCAFPFCRPACRERPAGSRARPRCSCTPLTARCRRPCPRWKQVFSFPYLRRSSDPNRSRSLQKAAALEPSD